jgi:hypothetical protein
MAVAITNDGLLGFVALEGGSVAMFDLIGGSMEEELRCSIPSIEDRFALSFLSDSC